MPNSEHRLTPDWPLSSSPQPLLLSTEVARHILFCGKTQLIRDGELESVKFGYAAVGAGVEHRPVRRAVAADESVSRDKFSRRFSGGDMPHHPPTVPSAPGPSGRPGIRHLSLPPSAYEKAEVDNFETEK